MYDKKAALVAEIIIVKMLMTMMTKITKNVQILRAFWIKLPILGTITWQKKGLKVYREVSRIFFVEKCEENKYPKSIQKILCCD